MPHNHACVLFTQKSKNYNSFIWSDKKYYEFDLVFPCKTEDNEDVRLYRVTGRAAGRAVHIGTVSSMFNGLAGKSTECPRDLRDISSLILSVLYLNVSRLTICSSFFFFLF